MSSFTKSTLFFALGMLMFSVLLTGTTGAKSALPAEDSPVVEKEAAPSVGKIEKAAEREVAVEGKKEGEQVTEKAAEIESVHHEVKVEGGNHIDETARQEDADDELELPVESQRDDDYNPEEDAEEENAETELETAAREEDLASLEEPEAALAGEENEATEEEPSVKQETSEEVPVKN